MSIVATRWPPRFKLNCNWKSLHSLLVHKAKRLKERSLKKAGVNNLQNQRSSHGEACRTDSFYTCASADVSLVTVTY